MKSSKYSILDAFKQQRLKSWQPILTPFPVIVSFLVVGIIFIPIGSILLNASNNVVQVTTRYDDISQCSVGSICNLTIFITETMTKPVYFYYQLGNYYQNYRRYVSSRCDSQLLGQVIDSYSTVSSCDPLISVDGSSDPNSFYLPCGLISASLFNDTFVLQQAGTVIPWTKHGIAWKSDIEYKFKNPPNYAPGVRIIPDFQDEDFIVWMRTAGLPNFKKLHRIIEQDLQPGPYSVIIESNYPVASFSGSKSVVLSTTSWIGGKNTFLGWSYIAVGIACFVQGIAFALKQKISPRKLGDPKYLNWSR